MVYKTFFRFVLQDSRDILVGFLLKILGSIHVLCKRLQYMHEDILHFIHYSHYLSYAIQKTVPDDLRLHW